MENKHQPAYPRTANEAFGGQEGAPQIGLTKLEAFTLAAMQGLCAGMASQVMEQTNPGRALLIKDLSAIAPIIATETLKQLEP